MCNNWIWGITQVPDLDDLMDMGVAFGRSSGQGHKGHIEGPFAEKDLHLDWGLSPAPL